MGLFVSLIGNEDSDSVQFVREKISLAGGRIPHEQMQIGENVNKVEGESFGSYSNLHKLRGFALYWEKLGRPPSDEERRQKYPLLQDLYDAKEQTQRFQHLIDHSDAEGYYVPVDFEKPVALMTEDEEFLSVGSSLRLLEELEAIRQPLWKGSDQTGPEILWELDNTDPHYTEKFVWCSLRWLCRNSRRFGLILRFG